MDLSEVAMKKIAIVNTSSLAKYKDLIERLENEVGPVEFVSVDKNIEPKQLADRLQDINYIVAGTTPLYGEEFMNNSITLEYISRLGIGYNNVDVKAGAMRNIKVSNVPGFIEKEDVAEHACALLMSLSKKVVIASNATKNQEWTVDRQRFFGNRIHKKKVGILGFGNIGKTFSRIMKEGFECEILVYDPFLSESEIKQYNGKKMTLDEIFEHSDIISLHINLTAETYHLIDEVKIKKMKKGCLLINTARGELVDEIAIAKALQQDKIGGYGCDVIENEPIASNNPLLEVKNALITPHIAVYNEECNYQMCESVVHDMIAVYHGNSPLNLLSK